MLIFFDLTMAEKAMAVDFVQQINKTMTWRKFCLQCFGRSAFVRPRQQGATVFARFSKVMTAVAFVTALGSAHGSVVYSNGGINSHIGAYSIGSGAHVSDSFTLSSATTLTSVTVGLWVDDETPTGLTWSIGSVAFGSDIGSGSANNLNNVYVTSNDSDDIYDSTFSINETLVTGTYWLTLTGATPANSVYWDIDNGPSQAKVGSGTVLQESNSFSLNGTAAKSGTVPEPATLALTGLALAGLAASRRKRAA